MQAGAGLSFDGHNMRPITCEDRLGSYHYVSKDSECSGTCQVHTERQRDGGTRFKSKRVGKMFRNEWKQKKTLDIGDCKAERRTCKLKISFSQQQTCRHLLREPSQKSRIFEKSRTSHHYSPCTVHRQNLSRSPVCNRWPYILDSFLLLCGLESVWQCCRDHALSYLKPIFHKYVHTVSQ